MGIKDDFKKIISERLTKAASSIFIDKALAIMDESADNKESYLAAADMIRKRIVLFIDANLAGEVFDILKKEIEHRELTPGTRRKYIRVILFKRVLVTYSGTD